MKHVIEYTDGQQETFEDGPVRSHDVQLTPLGVRVISLHKLSADDTVSSLFPWQGIRRYYMVGDLAKQPKMSAEGVNGS